MSSASSSLAQLKTCNDINVAVEESKETATENNNPGLGSDSQEVVSERRSENPSFGSGAVPTGNGFICRFCNKRCSSSQSLGGHMNSHTRELQWERKQKEMEQQFHRQWILSQYSQGGLSNDNNLGNTSEPFKRI
uniref:C2H2-type domain-containing protein n=1 Tax=Brassica oleracea var. oleracea TaxID=109376 RepID=A0A0D2ZXY7_BRAOL